MPVGVVLHFGGQCYQRLIRARPADDLQCSRHCAVVKSGGERDRRQSKHVHETCPAAEVVESPRAEIGQARIAFSDKRCPCRHDWKCNGVGIPERVPDKIAFELRARRYALRQRAVVDLKALAQALAQSGVKRSRIREPSMDPGGLALHDNEKMRVDRFDERDPRTVVQLYEIGRASCRERV